MDIQMHYSHDGVLLSNKMHELSPSELLMKAAAIFYSASWRPSDPWWNPASSVRGSVRGPRSSSGTSQADMSKLSITGKNSETLTTGPGKGLKARSWGPALVMGATRKRSTCCPVAIGSYWPTGQGVWSASAVHQILLCGDTAKPLWEEQPQEGLIGVTHPKVRQLSEENE